jgi:prevent-host-death family protein
MKFLDRQDRSSKRHQMKSLQLQEAKQQFSAVAEKAAGGQPQIVTKHGKPFVVILSVADWKKSRAPKRTLLEMLRSCPVDLTELDLTRSRELPRDLGL